MSNETLGAGLRALWADQEAFNRQLRASVPVGSPEYVDLVREFVLNLTDELHELLHVTVWKKHRRHRKAFNSGAADNELTDIFKMWLTLAQLHGWSPEKLLEAYAQKTAVVKQRYREEWLVESDGPCVVIDIDNVICDYIGGLLYWMLDHGYIDTPLYDRLCTDRRFLDADALGWSQQRWAEVKHRFRSEGWKRKLPLMPGAREFLEALRAKGLRIVLLTARPVDRWPNIYTDTVCWLEENRLPFDLLWWAVEGSKMERLFQDDVVSKIVFAVDDVPVLANAYAKHGIRSYLVHCADRSAVLHPQVRSVTNLGAVLQAEESYRVNE